MSSFVELVNELDRVIKQYPTEEAIRHIVVVRGKQEQKLLALAHLAVIYRSRLIGHKARSHSEEVQT